MMPQDLANPYFLLAFVLAPLAAVGFGWVLVALHGRDIRNRDTPPAE